MHVNLSLKRRCQAVANNIAIVNFILFNKNDNFYAVQKLRNHFIKKKKNIHFVNGPMYL